jgi:NADH-quinone oxidoreductase subunit L
MHAMGGVIDMRRFRGLRHRMPITCWTFAAGGLALSGIFPFAGFWSKDEILSALKRASHAQDQVEFVGAYTAIYWLAVLGALMTAFYTGRAFFLTFFGPEKLPSPDDPEAAEGDDAHASSHADPGHGHDPADSHGHDAHLGHESPPVMTYPLIVLAGCAALVGIVFGPTGWFEHHLEKTYAFEHLRHPTHGHGFDFWTALVGTVAGLIGVGASYFLYANPSPYPGRLARRFAPLYRISYHKFWVDEFYYAVFVRPLGALAWFFSVLDEWLLHGAIVRGTAWLPRLVGREVLAPLQNGLIQFYAAVTALGVAALLWILLLWH